MIDHAIVIYIPPKVASSYTIWCLEPILGSPMLAQLLKRLHAGMPAGDYQFVVACHEDVVVERIRAAIDPKTATIFSSKTINKLDLFTEFVAAHPHVKTLLVFPDETLLPDLRTCQQMVNLHRREHAEATIVLDAPPGLLPEVYQSSSLKRLHDIGLPADLSSDFLTVMEKANSLFHDEPKMCFKVLKLSMRQVNGPAPEKLPASLLIFHRNAWSAAEKAMTVGVPLHDPTAAYALYKEEQRRLNASTDFTFTVPVPAAGKIPILFNTQYGAFTGGQECFYDLIANLDREHFAPIVSLPLKGVLSQKLEAAGVPVEIGYFEFNELSPWSLRYFDALLHHTGAQLLHVDGDPAEAPILAAFQRKIPFIFHLRQFLGRNLPSRAQFAARVITGSKAVAKDVLSSDIDPANVVQIYESLDVKAFHPERYQKAALRTAAGIGLDKKVITMITRIEPEKRVELLIQALPRVVKEFPETLVLIVGESYASGAHYVADLQNQIAEWHLESHVRFWGFERTIAPIHAMSDVLVNCTDNEPFGHSILEALAMRVPVVAPNRGGHTEILEHYKNAVIFPVGDAAALATELIRLLGHPETAKKLSDAGRQTIEKLDISQHVRQVEDLYRSVLEN